MMSCSDAQLEYIRTNSVNLLWSTVQLHNQASSGLVPRLHGMGTRLDISSLNAGSRTDRSW